MSDIRIRAAKGLIASIVRSASKEARNQRRLAGQEARKADDHRIRAQVADEAAVAAEGEANTIQSALSQLP